MDASRAIAPPIPDTHPGTQPAPNVDETPGGAAPPGEGTAETPPDRRRRKLALILLLLGSALVLIGFAIWYLLFRQPINPIPPLPGEVVMPGYVTAVYGAERPMGVAVNAAGDRIYVGETEGRQTARVFDGQGNELAALLPPKSTGTDHVPVYLAIDPLTSQVYVTDRPQGAIYVYDANGGYQREFSAQGAPAGWQPLAIAFDGTGNLYVSDVSSVPQRVLVFDRGGALVRTIGDTAKLSFPNGIALDPAGNVYITDSNNGRLLVFGADGALVAQVGRGVGEGNLGMPRGVVVGGGRVYVADATGQGVFVFSQLKPGEQRLAYLGFFGGEGVANGTFEFPNGIAADGRGRLYVTDSANDRVQLWSY